MDTIDTRNLQKRIDELDELDLSADEVDELVDLQFLAMEIGDEFRHGVQLIAVNDFKEYAQMYAEDCGYIGNEDSWPYTCIDWEMAADELVQDFIEVDYNGKSYYARV